MSLRTVGWLALVTAIVAALAAFVVSRQGSTVRTELTGGALFPALADRITSLDSIELRRGEQSCTLQRRGEQWTIADRHHYPAQVDRVRELVLALMDLKLLERKTATPALYSRIGVDDPASPDARGTLVRLRDAQGQELASVIIGQVAAGVGTPALYVRKPDEPQSWLVTGRIDVPTDPLRWMSREIVRIPRDRVQAVTVRTSEGDVLHLQRTDADQRDFEIADMPPDRELRSSVAYNPLVTALASVTLDDVAPAGSMDVELADASTCQFETFDGLIVRVHLWPREPDEDDSAAELDDSAEADQADPWRGGSWALFEAEATDDATDEIHAEATELTERWRGWVYALPVHKTRILRTRLEDLLKPLPEPAPQDRDAAAPLEDDLSPTVRELIEDDEAPQPEQPDERDPAEPLPG